MKLINLSSLMVLVACAVAPTSALANCTVSVPELTIPTDTVSVSNPNATPLWQLLPNEWWGAYVNERHVFLCNPAQSGASHAQGVGQRVGSFTENGRTYDVYSSGISGVGLAFQISDPVVGRIHPLINARTEIHRLPRFDFVGYLASYGYVRTGTIAAGVHTLPRQKVGTLSFIGWQTRTSGLYVASRTLVVTNPTCDLAVGDVNRTVTLPVVRVEDFRSANAVGKTDFSISATCDPAVTRATFTFSGAAAPGNGQYFANSGGAPGTALWLYSRIGGTEATIQANGSNNARTINVASGRAELPLGAAYYRVGTVGKGGFRSQATVNLTYN